jgi:hypothetical protein
MDKAMKLVRESLNEKITYDEKVDGILSKEIARLRSDVFPKLNDDELDYFTQKLRDWVLDMRMEKNKFSGYQDEPQKDWGGPGSKDFKPGWGEMGG